MKRLSPFDLTFTICCLVACLLTMGLNWNSPVARSIIKGERVYTLLIGSDYEDYARHSDTLMVVSYEPKSRFLDVLSIPRDTQVNLPGLPGIRRVNEIFAYEFRKNRKDFNITAMVLKSYVETILSSGTVKINIPYYFVVDYKSFRNVIDAMGGIYIKVTEPMHYDDNWGKLHIHFDTGTYRMDGKTALEYVRYRGGANADHGRILRQQIFIKEVVKRLKSPVLLWRGPKYAKLVLDGIHTNLSAWDLFTLLMEGRTMNWKNIRLFGLPGSSQGVLWKMNSERTQSVVEMMKSPITQTLPPSTESRNRTSLETKGASTVEVWNASRYPNAARIVIRVLRDNGFDVVEYGSFKKQQARTLVIDRSGQLRPAQSVADVLRAVHPEVISRIDLTRHVDVSVILGNDASFKDPKGWGR